jgi:pimeloyl-ACP methyl ester carboxylesterase
MSALEPHHSKFDATLVMLPGLAADQGLFEALELPGVNVVHPGWLEPASSDESLSAYTKRYGRWLLERVSKDNLYLCGMSFGGLVALEIAKQFHETKKALLIASPILRSQTTAQFRGLEFLLRTLPDGAVRQGLRTVGIGRLRCVESLQTEHVALLDEMVKRMDMSFFRWATRACATWEGGVEALTDMPAELKARIEILQGQYDHVIPPIRDQQSFLTNIDDGKHLINFTHARQVSHWITQAISRQP